MTKDNILPSATSISFRVSVAEMRLAQSFMFYDRNESVPYKAYLCGVLRHPFVYATHFYTYPTHENECINHQTSAKFSGQFIFITQLLVCLTSHRYTNSYLFVLMKRVMKKITYFSSYFGFCHVNSCNKIENHWSFEELELLKVRHAGAA